MPQPLTLARQPDLDRNRLCRRRQVGGHPMATSQSATAGGRPVVSYIVNQFALHAVAAPARPVRSPRKAPKRLTKFRESHS